MTFRGTAIVMVGHQQGLGRSTLGDMLSTLFGDTNTESLELSAMLEDKGFNEWREKCFLIVEEAKALSGASRYDAYEKLKTYVDPRAGKVTINPKFGRKRVSPTNSSFLFLSNHVNALAIPENDRRFYVMENTLERGTPAFFTEVNQWLQEKDVDGMPAWARSVFRWLRAIDVDMEALLAPPVETAIKKEMAGASQSIMDFTLHSIVEPWPSKYICSQDIKKIFAHALLNRLEYDDKTQSRHVASLLSKLTTGYGQKGVCRSPEFTTLIRPRVITAQLKNGGHVEFPQAGEAPNIADITQAMKERVIDYNAIAIAVNDLLTSDDR